MKIRTDFVTNSSSSSFTIRITIDTVDDQTLSCELSSGEEQEYGYLVATKSPAELGQCSSIDELKDLLRTAIRIDDNEVPDEEYCEEIPEFIEEVGGLSSMDDIKTISVSSWLHGHSEAEQTEVYTYYRDQGVTVHAECHYPDDEDADEESDEDDYEDFDDYEEDGLGDPAGELAFDANGKVEEGKVNFDGYGGIRARL